jgi:hypothetical protein
MGVKRGRRLASVGAVLVVVFSGVAAVAARPVDAQVVPTLGGETFVATNVVIGGNCSGSAGGTLTFTASGVATGPNPGTFEEAGYARVVDTGGFEDSVVEFAASFIIHTATGDEITGSKVLQVMQTGAQNTAVCTGGTQDAFLVQARYTAQFPGGGTEEGSSPNVFAVENCFSINVGGVILSDCGVFLPMGPFPVGTSGFYEDFVAPEAPSTTPGKTTGGGQIQHVSSNSGEVTFGLQAQSSGTTSQDIKATCLVEDRAAQVHINCIDADSYSQVGNQATFSGHARQNDAQVTYTIHVTDNGDPGAGTDEFSISTSAGYSQSGTLTQGNIQVHPLR